MDRIGLQGAVQGRSYGFLRVTLGAQLRHHRFDALPCLVEDLWFPVQEDLASVRFGSRPVGVLLLVEALAILKERVAIPIPSHLDMFAGVLGNCAPSCLLRGTLTPFPVEAQCHKSPRPLQQSATPQPAKRLNILGWTFLGSFRHFQYGSFVPWRRWAGQPVNGGAGGPVGSPRPRAENPTPWQNRKGKAPGNRKQKA